MTALSDKTACFIVIGNEILSGRTQDTNLAYLGTRLDQWGIRLREARVIPDVADTIAAAVNACRSQFDYVFTSGGIGPTHDDITTASVAAAFGVAVREHPEALRRLTDFYGRTDITAARRKMASLPDGATLIDNPVSAAPGFCLQNVYVLAGIPVVFQAMLDSLAGSLAGGAPMLTHSVTTNLREGEIAAGLSRLQLDYTDIDIGSYPFFRGNQHGVSIVCRGTDRRRLQRLIGDVEALVQSLGGAVTAQES